MVTYVYYHVNSKIKKWPPFNVITFTPFHKEKEMRKNIQNSERQDHFMISCFFNPSNSGKYPSR